jgi:hypothetical protein
MRLKAYAWLLNRTSGLEGVRLGLREYVRTMSLTNILKDQPVFKVPTPVIGYYIYYNQVNKHMQRRKI